MRQNLECHSKRYGKGQINNAKSGIYHQWQTLPSEVVSSGCNQESTHYKQRNNGAITLNLLTALLDLPLLSKLVPILLYIQWVTWNAFKNCQTTYLFQFNTTDTSSWPSASIKLQLETKCIFRWPLETMLFWFSLRLLTKKGVMFWKDRNDKLDPNGTYFDREPLSGTQYKFLEEFWISISVAVVELITDRISLYTQIENSLRYQITTKNRGEEKKSIRSQKKTKRLDCSTKVYKRLGSSWWLYLWNKRVQVKELEHGVSPW